MSEQASISSGIAARYATAMFDLAREARALAVLERDIDALDAGLSASADLRGVVASPLLSRAEQERAIVAVAKGMGLSAIASNTLALMAQKRRLFVLPQMIADVRARLAEEKGEMTAEVTAATALTAAQSGQLAATLKARFGKNVIVKTAVDGSLIGGLVVRLGSTMIDTSIKAKLAALQNSMKEVG